MKVPVIDYIECLGCETCAIMCPDVFYMSHDKAWVREHAPYDSYDLRQIWRSCPARCISFVDVPEDGRP